MQTRCRRRTGEAIAQTDHLRAKVLYLICLTFSLLFLGIAAANAESHEEVTISHGYSNFGELKYGPDDPFSYVNVDAPKGGEVSLWAEGTFDSFNGFTRKGVTAASYTLPYEDLMIAAADDPYGIYCNLCETIEYPESLDWVIVNLRENVTFSDGSPMTANDVKFTVDLFLEQGITEFRELFKSFYESVEVQDTHRIKFTFSEDTPKRDRVGLVGLWNPFSKAQFEQSKALATTERSIELLASGMSEDEVKAQLAEEMDTLGLRLDDSQPEPFMGTGPYVLGEVEFGRRIVYEKDPNWWGADLPINQGRFNFDSIRVEYFADSSAALEGFKAGEYTFRVENTSRIWATAYDFPALNDGYVRKETLIDGAITTAQGFVFNLRKPEWQDARVRDAIRLMFNFEWTNQTLFYDLYQRPASFWGGSDLAAEGTPEGVEADILQGLVDDGLLDASILVDEASIPPVNEAGENLPDRRVFRQAEKLFEEAGWVADDKGMLRNADGELLELTILQQSQAFDRIVNPFVENLVQAGVSAQLERVDNAQYTERRRSGDWDLVNHSPGQDFEPSTGLRQWFASEAAEDSSRNIMALAEPGIDRLIDEVVAAETLDELRPRVRALDRVLRAHGFWIAQWTNQEHWAAFWDQYGFPDPFPPLSIGAFSGAVIDFWWYDQDRAARLRNAGAL